MTNKIRPPVHIVWSTDEIDLDDPFQRRWYIQQVLINGRMEDIRKLDLSEVASILGELNLPEDVRSLRKNYFKVRNADR